MARTVCFARKCPQERGKAFALSAYQVPSKTLPGAILTSFEHLPSAPPAPRRLDPLRPPCAPAPRSPAPRSPAPPAPRRLDPLRPAPRSPAPLGDKFENLPPVLYGSYGREFNGSKGNLPFPGDAYLGLPLVFCRFPEKRSHLFRRYNIPTRKVERR